MDIRTGYLKTKQAAQQIGIDPATLLLWVKRGIITSYPINCRVILFDPKDIASLINKGTK